MTRGRWLGGVALTALLLPGVVLAATAEPHGRWPGDNPGVGEGGSRPDVVIILTDDQRPETVPPMAQVQGQIAAAGVTFTNAMVPTPLCCPSRASLLTGRFAHHTGVWSNARPTGGWWAFHANGNEGRTLAVALHRRGYRTALVGKYFNSFGNWAPAGYRPQGWDRFTAFITTRRSGSYFGYPLSDGSVHGTGAGDYSTDVLARDAVRFIRSTTAGEPLFLYFAPYAPHAPPIPAPRHLGAWAGRLPPYRPPSVGEDVSDKPAWVRRLPPVPTGEIERLRRRQQEALMAVDEAVGAIIGALRATGRLGDSLLVYTSDNGLMWGDHNIRAKAVPYAQAMRVPLVVRWDGRIPPGGTDSRLALNVDLTATIDRATAAGMSTDGRDLLGARQRKGFVMEAPPEPRVARPAYCGWRSARWSFVRYATGEEELYDESADPYELDNLAGVPALASRQAALRALARSHCSPTPPGFAW